MFRFIKSLFFFVNPGFLTDYAIKHRLKKLEKEREVLLKKYPDSELLRGMIKRAKLIDDETPFSDEGVARFRLSVLSILVVIIILIIGGLLYWLFNIRLYDIVFRWLWFMG